MQKTQRASRSTIPNSVADAFTEARLAARSLSVYPGTTPTSLEEAYAIQDAAIKQWPDEIVGWKVGRINAPYIDELGCDRLVGPIFKRAVRRAGGVAEMPVFNNGFAAVEAECIFIIGEDAPEDKTSWSREEAQAIVSAAVAGIEIASSPFPGINDFGPLVTISDFGNNNGLIIGEEIPDWRDFTLDDWIFETFIDGERIGAAPAATMPGGPLEALRFSLENTARRGFHLKQGMAISSGAVTGVHPIWIGQSAFVRFPNLNDISCKIIAATPSVAPNDGDSGRAHV